MKNSFIFLIFSVSCLCADFFTDQLNVKKPITDLRYYNLLPDVDSKKPDLWSMRTRDPQSMSLEDEFLAAIEDVFVPSVFIETGTFEGDTTQKAEKYFMKIETIELDKKLAEKARKRFKNNTKIKVHQGDTIKVLPTILKSLQKEKAVIFLDAHFSMGVTAKGDTNTPILTELDIIKKSGITNAILIIDDIRMFYHPLSCEKDSFFEGYPTLNEIVATIISINPDYRCAVVYDVLIAFPAQEKITVSPVVHAMTLSRLYTGDNYHIDDVLKAELTIAKAEQKERDIITDLAQRWTEKWSEAAGFSRHYILWLGLILLAYENYDNALKALQDAQKRGFLIAIGW